MTKFHIAIAALSFAGLALLPAAASAQSNANGNSGSKSKAEQDKEKAKKTAYKSPPSPELIAQQNGTARASDTPTISRSSASRTSTAKHPPREPAF